MELGAGLDHQPQGGVVHVGAVGQVQVLQGRDSNTLEGITRWGLRKYISFNRLGAPGTNLLSLVVIYLTRSIFIGWAKAHHTFHLLFQGYFF